MKIADFIDTLTLIFTYGPDLEEVLKEKKREREDAERKTNRHRLDLCFKHRQEQNRSIFSEGNCDYCKLLAKKED